MYRGCQTAATFDGTLDWKRAWLADPKVDGVRALLLPLGGSYSVWSRRGRRIDRAQHIAEAVRRVLGGGFVLDGELWSGNFPDTVSCLNRGSALNRPGFTGDSVS